MEPDPAALLANVLAEAGRISLDCRRSGTPGGRQAAACALYFTAMLEDARALLVLLRAGGLFSAPKLLRGVLECAANVANIERDPEYVEYLFFESLYKKLKHFRKVREHRRQAPEGGGPVLRESDMRRLEDALKILAARFKKPLNFEEKFRRAGMDGVYVLSYSLLGDAAHAAFVDVATRFGAGCGERPETDAAEAAAWAWLAAMALADGADRLCRVAAFSAGDRLLRLKRELLRFRREAFPDGRPTAR